MKKLIILILLALSSITYGQLSQINVGISANDGTGESLRSAFQKVNLGITQINTNTGNIALKLAITDTTNMLLRYINKADTAAMLSKYLRIADTVGIGGGAAFDTNYLYGVIGEKLAISDTSSMLQRYINKADTSVMLSKYVRKLSPTFTGTVKLDTIGENISANGIVMKGELTITGTDKKTGYFYAGTNAPTFSTRLNYDGNLWVNWLYPAVIKYGRPGVDNIVSGVDPHTSGLSNRVSSNSVANLYIDASNSQDGIGGVGGTNIGFIINNVMKFSSKATQNESSVKLLVDDIGEYTTGHSVVFASIPKVSTTDTLSTKAYARSVGLGGGGGVSEATVSAIVSDSIVARLNGATKISDVAVMLADTVPIVTFSLGAGLPADTACFNNGVLAGSFYNEGSDTLKITQLMGILKEGTGTETIAVQIAWHATFLSGSATLLNSSALTVNSLTTGTEDTSFANAKIPPNVFVWCILSGASKNNKPTFLNVTLSGYKIPKY